jgi:hypothetical protein
MSDMVFSILSAVVGLLGTVFGLVTLFRNKKSDDKDEGEKEGVVLTELGYIKKGIHGIENRLEKQEIKYVEIVTQLAEIRASAKQAHRRIDVLEEFRKQGGK